MQHILGSPDRQKDRFLELALVLGACHGDRGLAAAVAACRLRRDLDDLAGMRTVRHGFLAAVRRNVDLAAVDGRHADRRGSRRPENRPEEGRQDRQAGRKRLWNKRKGM